MWEITTLLRMTYFLRDGVQALWSPLSVPWRALAETCSVSAPWRDSWALEGAVARDQTRRGIDFYMKASSTSLPSQSALERRVPQPATTPAERSQEVRHLKTVYCNGRGKGRKPCPSFLVIHSGPVGPCGRREGAGLPHPVPSPVLAQVGWLLATLSLIAKNFKEKNPHWYKMNNLHPPSPHLWGLLRRQIQALEGEKREELLSAGWGGHLRKNLNYQ